MRITMPAVALCCAPLCRAERAAVALLAWGTPTGRRSSSGGGGRTVHRRRIALVVDGGICRGPGPTVVDCTVSPPVVRRVGALPESYVDAAMMMGHRRRKWFGRRPNPD